MKNLTNKQAAELVEIMFFNAVVEYEQASGDMDCSTAFGKCEALKGVLIAIYGYNLAQITVIRKRACAAAKN